MNSESVAAMTRRMRENKQTAIVLLEGIRVATEKTGIAPLCRAIRSVGNPDDEILVLIILYAKTSEPLSSSVFEEAHHCNPLCEAEPYISFLRQEITQKKEIYKQILKPFYNGCKSNGVKFQAKIAAGFRLMDVIVEEANNAKATWIVMDSCFAGVLSLQLSGTDCIVSLVSGDEESKANDCIYANKGHESSIFRDIDDNPRSGKLKKGATSEDHQGANSSFPSAKAEYQSCYPSLQMTLQKGSDYQDGLKPFKETAISREAKPHQAVGGISQTVSSELKEHNTVTPSKAIFLSCYSPSNANPSLGEPLQLSWEVIVEISQGFKSSIKVQQDRNYLSYYGYLEENQSIVLVRKFRGDWGRMLEAEKKAALSLHHRNILGLIGYHRNENDTVLVFPFDMERTLDKYLCDSSKQLWNLTFEDKMKIALGTCQGLRYMHEECPRGPVVHGTLLPDNIFLTSDFKPMISGFGNATWLQVEQEPAISGDRCPFKDNLDQRSASLIKSDVLAYGILLLRLFCGRTIPQDDKILVEMARPLLLQKAFHLLLDEDSDDTDVHAIYRVMTAATLCTNTNPASRPCMSEVIAILKGEKFCPAQSLSSPDSIEEIGN